MSSGLGRPPPNPRFGSVVELDSRHLHSVLNLISIGKALASEGITAEETPPTLLQVEPAGSFRNEHLVDTWMVCQPGTRFQAVMAAQTVSNDEDVAGGFVRLDALEKFNVMLGIARGGTPGDLF